MAFYPYVSQAMPRYYGLTVECEVLGTRFVHSRISVELYTLVALLGLRPYSVAGDFTSVPCNRQRLRYGNRSYLLPKDVVLEGDPTKDYKTLLAFASSTSSLVPNYMIHFNRDDSDAALQATPNIIALIKSVMVRMGSRHYSDISAKFLKHWVFYYNYGVVTNGFVRGSQCLTALEQLYGLKYSDDSKKTNITSESWF